MQDVDIFEECRTINNLILNNEKKSAREQLIKLLDYCKKNNLKYTPLINNLIRQLGLYPYLDITTADWNDRLAYNSFKVDIGNKDEVVLHIEQSYILKKLLEGNNLTLSAPTSFGKSFIIDAFIKLKKPKNIMIVVPTIALMDETRRRIYKKFSKEYKIITSLNADMNEKNIFIFPQERAITYSNKINNLDILIIDEFYKASDEFDSKERSLCLLNEILSQKTKQKYFIAPNISKINPNIFTNDTDFISLDFNTVFLEKHELYSKITKKTDKENIFVNLLKKIINSKTLIYAGSYSQINKISEIIINNISSRIEKNDNLKNFSNWLKKNYSDKWILPSLVEYGYGIHNGKLHRSVSQIQIKLFDEEQGKGLDGIISTSSIIEGVNTSAENIILWSRKNGSKNINSFVYKNIIGRGGRMFKYFVGNVFLLEKPPEEEKEELNLEIPNELIESSYVQENNILTEDQIKKIKANNSELDSLVGKEISEKLKKEHFSTIVGTSQLLKEIKDSILPNKDKLEQLNILNNNIPDSWTNTLYNLIKISKIPIEYSKFVNFIKIVSQSWNKSLPCLLNELERYGITIDNFFDLEKKLTYNFASFLSDINLICKNIGINIDISSFISKISYAFLPQIVYQLEEYCLPRVISRKLQDYKILNFEDEHLTLQDTINLFNTRISKEYIISKVKTLDEFDKYILDYFYDGITIK